MGQDPPVMVENRREMMKWESQLKMIPKRAHALETGMQQAYAIIWDQCSVTMTSKLEELANYDQINLDKNPVTLLNEIRNIVCGRETHKQPLYSMVQLLKAFTLLKQDYNESNEKYKERFDGVFDSVIQQGGSVTTHPGLIATRAQAIATAANRVNNIPAPDDTAAATQEIAEEIKACFMLSGANNTRHGKLKNYLENKFICGDPNSYPKTTTEVLSRMNNFRSDQAEPRRHINRATEDKDDDDGLQFVQEGSNNNNNNDSDAGQPGVQMLMKGNQHSNQRKELSYAEAARANNNATAKVSFSSDIKQSKKKSSPKSNNPRSGGGQE